MNENQSLESNSTKSMAEILLNFFQIIVKWRKFLSRFILSSILITIIVTLLLPKWYKSSTTVIPAEKSELLGALEGVSSLVKSFGGGKSVLGGNTDIDRYTAILKSDTLLMTVIEKFDLSKVYDIKSYIREKTLKELSSNMDVEETDEGNLNISVYDTDPQRASDMANFMVAQLNFINSRINSQNATANREFIEQRYNKNVEDLSKAEEYLRRYQERTKTMIVPSQNNSSISAIAELYALKAKKEIELVVLKKTVSKDNSTLQQNKLEVEELNRKIDSLPTTTIESLRLYRDVAIQQKIMEFLTPVLEQAKMEERRSTPSVLVLDNAVPAERKSKPKISLYALLAFVISSLVSLFVIFFMELYFQLRKNNQDLIDNLFTSVKSDYFGLKTKINKR